MAASVSIIICTRDRAESLRQTLESLSKCQVPADLMAELVVVDNGSTDHTQAIVEASVFDGSPVRRVSEQAPGLSRARNAGLRATSSDVILFTDDDVRVPDGWISGMCRPILAGEADAVAGGVHFPADYEPRLSEEPFRSRRSWLASTENIDPHEPDSFVGANMAFSRQVVEALGEFDPQLGAGALGFCEESLFAYRLIDAGWRIKTALNVSVEHHFDLSRLTRKTLLSMAARMGRSAAYVDYHWGQQDTVNVDAKLRRAKALLVLEKLKAPWRSLTQALTSEEVQRVQTLAYWQELAGLAGQSRRYQRASSSVR